MPSMSYSAADLSALAAIPTPAYVFDLAAFRNRIQAVREAFGPTVNLCYSIKANPFLIQTAERAGLDLEVCSPGELEICNALGVDPSRIVYSGVCKGEKDVRSALAARVKVFTAESPSQLDLIVREVRAARAADPAVDSDFAAGSGSAAVSDSVAGSNVDPVPVLLRLSAGSQFGMCKSDLLGIIDRRDELADAVELVGIHYFVGTQRRKLKHQVRELDKLRALLVELEAEHGWRPQKLEYGPGLAHPYYADEDFSDTLAPARELAPALVALASEVELTVEMGRFFSSPCGTYLTSIVDLKGSDEPATNYAFVDGGINHVNYLGQMMGLKLPVVRNLSREACATSDSGRGDAEHPWTLCGSLCTTNDVLIRQYEQPLSMGDVLAFENVGAYSITEALYLFLSRDMPAVLFVDRDSSGELTFALARDVVSTSSINTPQPLN